MLFFREEVSRLLPHMSFTFALLQKKNLFHNDNVIRYKIAKHTCLFLTIRNQCLQINLIGFDEFSTLKKSSTHFKRNILSTSINSIVNITWSWLFKMRRCILNKFSPWFCYVNESFAFVCLQKKKISEIVQIYADDQENYRNQLN